MDESVCEPALTLKRKPLRYFIVTIGDGMKESFTTIVFNQSFFSIKLFEGLILHPRRGQGW